MHKLTCDNCIDADKSDGTPGSEIRTFDYSRHREHQVALLFSLVAMQSGQGKISGFVSQWGTSVWETLISFNELQRNLPSHFPEGRCNVWYPDKETHLLSTWKETLSLSSKVVYCMNILVKIFWTKSWYKMCRNGRHAQEITAAVFYVKVLVLRTLGDIDMEIQCKTKCII